MTKFTLWPSMTSLSFVSDPEGAAQQPYAKRLLISTQLPVDNVLRSYISTAKMFGDNILAPQVDDAYSALISANPTKLWYYNILTEPSNPSGATTSNPIVLVTLIQYVEMYGRLSLSST